MSNYEMSSNVIELSEHKTYIELTRRLCYYDYPNLNGVQLNSDTAEEKAQSLLMQPVVAKYKRIRNMKKEEILRALKESAENVKKAEDTVANIETKVVEDSKPAEGMPNSELPTQKEIEKEAGGIKKIQAVESVFNKDMTQAEIKVEVVFNGRLKGKTSTIEPVRLVKTKQGWKVQIK